VSTLRHAFGTISYATRAVFVDTIAVGGGLGCPDARCALAAATIPAARRARAFSAMPNIRQQEKRVRVAARQRLENLRYRSSVKTLTKRLETAATDGDAERVAAEHLELVRTIDKAAAHGAMHKNTAARKKARAARIAAGTGS
jgi:small subunit ribosomal protein S20